MTVPEKSEIRVIHYNSQQVTDPDHSTSILMTRNGHTEHVGFETDEELDELITKLQLVRASDSEDPPRCGYCGDAFNLGENFGMINNKMYHHPDDDSRPNCYELATWKQGAPLDG